jgi:homopolymeric O-antigen transport system permease protein
MTTRTSIDNGTDGRDGTPVLRLDSRPESLWRWLGGLWRYRSLLVALARKDFRVRYKRASLGILWSVAVPIFQTAVLVFIFSRVGNFGSGATYSYAGFVLAGMVPWLYVSSSLPSSTTSIVDASTLTDKVFFPRAVLPLVTPCANLVTLAISTLILLVALPIVGQSWAPHLLLLIPATALLFAFSAALGLAVGGLYVYFRDVKFMVQAVILVWFYVTPIVYPASALKGAGPWLDFNPLTGVVGLFQRAAVDAPVPSTRALVVSVVTTIVVAVVAMVGHRRHDRLFVDLL